MKKTIIIGLIVLLIIPMTLAADRVFSDEKDIDFKVTCTDSDLQLCGSTTDCFISIQKPDNTDLVKNASMSFNQMYYNYTVLRPRIENNYGEYIFSVYCQDLTNDEYDLEQFVVEINQDGQRSSNSIIIWVLLVLIYVMLALSFIVEDYTLGMLASIGMIVFGVYVAINGINLINNLATQLLGILNIAAGAYIFIAGNIQQIDGG